MTVGDPGVQGDVVTGIQGCGVNTPKAADVAAATWFSQERARLSKQGLMPSYPDGQIAAVAAVNDLILITRNVDDFVEFSGLQISNWFT